MAQWNVLPCHNKTSLGVGIVSGITGNHALSSALVQGATKL